MVAVQEEEGRFPVLAGEHEAQRAAPGFQRFEFIIRQREAFAHPEEVRGRGDVADAAGDTKIFRAAAGEEVRVMAGDRGDGGEDFIQVPGQDEGEEVVHVRDLIADGDLGEAGGNGEFPQGDAGSAVGDENGAGGFQDVVAPLAFPRCGGGTAWAGLCLGTHEAGWDGLHGRRLGLFSEIGQQVFGRVWWCGYGQVDCVVAGDVRAARDGAILPAGLSRKPRKRPSGNWKQHASALR
jgi:hypothetical protein